MKYVSRIGDHEWLYEEGDVSVRVQLPGTWHIDFDTGRKERIELRRVAPFVLSVQPKRDRSNKE